MLASRILIFVCLAVAVNGDAKSDFLNLLKTMGVKLFAVSDMQKIANCEEPTIYAQSTADEAGKKLKSCFLNFCVTAYSTCAPALTALSNNDKCLKPETQTTWGLVDKLAPNLYPFVKEMYNNMTTIVGQGKSKGLTQANVLLGAYAYGNKVVNRALADNLCQKMLPYMTALEKKCTLANIGAVFNVTGTKCATAMG